MSTRFGSLIAFKYNISISYIVSHLQMPRVEDQNPPAVDNRRLLSYNHLLLIPRLARFPPADGDGVAGPRLDSRKVSLREALRPSGDDPRLCLRPVPETALYSNGLLVGEKEGPPETLRPELRPEKLALGDNGDAFLLAGLAERESWYFGGVT